MLWIYLFVQVQFEMSFENTSWRKATFLGSLGKYIFLLLKKKHTLERNLIFTVCMNSHF